MQTDDDTQSSFKCSFPTIYGGKRYDKCFKKDDESDYFCPINTYREEKQESLGICSNTCPKYAGMSIFRR